MGFSSEKRLKKLYESSPKTQMVSKLMMK